ncbi:rhodanese-like domain-containing protein [Methylomonas sp. SURF-2]|uniref:Rhodanese-like domain-containing protein n=1 Tax=Methylomonas subterranea TaxID=2952225 RepID=A0ABT1TKJ3_9GAMM|nr:rhodanese-like domain-containing protein [Methylomonas sp. SURF-2]MCQ8105602.1 rhodanese-like domain-containing protein [Methylomonas sp. SURF-2]
MNKYFSILALFLVAAGCQFQQPDYVRMISATELHNILQDRDVLLIDVHTPEQKHIKGTDFVIPYNQIEAHQDRLPADKNTPIYLYCEGGPMGNAAARSLHALGYENLFNLDGGTHAWKQAGFELE